MGWGGRDNGDGWTTVGWTTRMFVYEQDYRTSAVSAEFILRKSRLKADSASACSMLSKLISRWKCGPIESAVYTAQGWGLCKGVYEDPGSVNSGECVYVCDCTLNNRQLQPRSQNCEKRLQASKCLSVDCPSFRIEQLGSNWIEFHEIWSLRIFGKYVGKVHFFI